MKIKHLITKGEYIFQNQYLAMVIHVVLQPGLCSGLNIIKPKSFIYIFYYIA